MATQEDGPTPLERFLNGILPENPVYRQMLGLCPTLAVTAAMKPAMTMAAAVLFVLVCANILVSLIRHLLKPHLRILVFTLTIAVFVTIADPTNTVVATVQGFTDTAGEAQLDWKSGKRQASGTYSATVTSLIKEGYTFDSTTGVTSVTFTIQ